MAPPAPILPHLQILSHPLTNNNDPPPPIQFRPELNITLFDQPYTVLLDSGASVSAISEDLYNNIKKYESTKELLSFPLTGIILSTALNGKNRKITTQIFISFKIQEQSTHAVFLVVPGLSTSLILGNDWLVENQVNLNYQTKYIIFPHWDIQFPFFSTPPVTPLNSNVLVDQSIMHSNSININSTTLHLNNIKFTENLNFIDTTAKILYSKTIPPASTPSSNCKTDIPLSPNQQSQISSLIQQYQPIFKDRPGLHKFFSYKFNIINDTPFKIKPYPVPFSRRPAILKELNRMLEWGVIERSNSPYNNPILSVQKPDGSIRITFRCT